jgi:hypothetical protein
MQIAVEKDSSFCHEQKTFNISRQQCYKKKNFTKYQ